MNEMMDEDDFSRRLGPGPTGAQRDDTGDDVDDADGDDDDGDDDDNMEDDDE